ncbi:MAG: hypothetical protein QM811_22040 [Pirellulales bacterium]
MDDDFNTGVGTACLYDLLRTLNKFADNEKFEAGKPDPAKWAEFDAGCAAFRELAAIVGVFREPQSAKAAGGDDELVGKLMSLVIEIRANARKNKDFATADLVRKKLTEFGVALEDRPGGTEWTKTG